MKISFSFFLAPLQKNLTTRRAVIKSVRSKLQAVGDLAKEYGEIVEEEDENGYQKREREREEEREKDYIYIDIH